MEFNRKTVKTILGIIAFAVLLFWGVHNIGDVVIFLGRIIGILMPLIAGVCIAFLLNCPLRFLENKAFRPLDRKLGKRWRRIRRPLAIALALLFVGGILIFVIFLVVPELVNTFGIIGKSLPAFTERLQQWVEPIGRHLPELKEWIASIQLDWDKIYQSIVDFFQNGATSLVNSTFVIAASVFSGIFTTLLGTVFAVYMLARKEALISQVKRVFYAYLPEKRVDRLVETGRLANRTFSKFITGQCTEAVILGVLCLVGMLIFGFPYPVMIGVLIGFTALIPLFGAFIGIAIGAVLIFVINPGQALWFILFIVVLQQIEGNLIYPRVVGTSVGMPAMWVLFAATIGGSLLGIIGMLVMVPIASVIYALIKQATTRRLKDKDIPPEKIE